MKHVRLFCRHAIQKVIQGKPSNFELDGLSVHFIVLIALNFHLFRLRTIPIILILFPHRFCLAIKPGGLIRVHTSALQPTSLYKSLVISAETTSDELLTLLLSCCNSSEPVEQFSIYEVRVNSFA